MKAAIIDQPNTPIRIEERPRPKPGPGQVLIKVHACGVCHSDLYVQLGAFPFATYPRIPGHEVAGVVEEVGSFVTWPTVGDRVGMPWLYSSCGICEQCVRGDEVMCPYAQVTGVNVDGGFEEYMLAPATYVAPIPDELDFADAAPIMCAGLTVYNGMRNANFRPGQRVAVIGLGGLGHLAVLYAKAMGGRVAVLSTSPDKEDEARGLGAERFINTKAQNVVEALHAWDGGADLILATAPAVEPATASFPGLAPDGTLVVLGVGPGTINVNPSDLVGGRRHLMGSPSGSRKDIRAALTFAAAHDIRPQITRFPLEQAGDALNEMHGGHMMGRAVLEMA
ncbi:MAG TPA: alcohol dehydrogenase catalytic domain-containing protein [Terriglobales bacterium]|nr:alcohol dehydrogenase catalytic domain-containing protein [Terriglobales bacterium]